MLIPFAESKRDEQRPLVVCAPAITAGCAEAGKGVKGKTAVSVFPPSLDEVALGEAPSRVSPFWNDRRE